MYRSLMDTKHPCPASQKDLNQGYVLCVPCVDLRHRPDDRTPARRLPSQASDAPPKEYSSGRSGGQIHVRLRHTLQKKHKVTSCGTGWQSDELLLLPFFYSCGSEAAGKHDSSTHHESIRSLYSSHRDRAPLSRYHLVEHATLQQC